MLDEILQFDQQLFHQINSNWQNSILDYWMPLFRFPLFWLPLYVFIVSYLVVNFKQKGLILIAFIALNFALSDGISSKIIKPNVKRLRPCNTEWMKKDMTLRIESCGSGYSFTSSHATNHFALSTFLLLTIGQIFLWTRIPLLIWAASVAFAQVYVGVHYPLDVFFGSILGVLIAYFCYFLYKKWLPAHLRII